MVQGRLYSPIPISPKAVQRLRLLLSTYQDGSGQLGAGTLPGWRDFERVTALTFGGVARESKSIFDVFVPHPTLPNKHYGISCKMRATLGDTRRTKRVTVEVSNAAAQFWEELRRHGYDHQNIRSNPAAAGEIVVNLVEKWNESVSSDNGGTVDLKKSSYLVLSYTKPSKRSVGLSSETYQLHQFPPILPDPTFLAWTCPVGSKGKLRLVGAEPLGAVLFEWYGESGGQLKYYPRVSDAVWQSEEFKLEPLPVGKYGLLNKAAQYFPNLWEECAP